MYVKLNYTSAVSLPTVFRVFTDIINNSSITSVSALTARFTSASYSSDLTTGFDATNSEIIRTVSPSTTVASYRRDSASATYPLSFIFTLEQTVYDASTKYYTQIASKTTTNSTLAYYGTGISGGTMSATAYPLNLPNTSTTADTTPALTITNSNSGVIVNAAQMANVYTFWAYLTDKCFIWGTTHGTSYKNGWGVTYGDGTIQSGPWITSQYTRFDYHNTNANGIVPVVYTNPNRGVGIGWGVATDYNDALSTTYTGNLNSVFKAMNMVSASPYVGTSWPLLTHQTVNWGCGSRTNEIYGLTVQTFAGTYATTASRAYVEVNKVLSTTSYQRWPNSTVQSTGFAMLPLTWSSNFYGNSGGNMTSQGLFYVFNGDYSPGDEFTYNGVTYAIWPSWQGYTNRLGLAIPKT